MFSISTCLVFIASTEHKIHLLQSIAIHISMMTCDAYAADHMVRTPRPSPSVFACCNWRWERPGTEATCGWCWHPTISFLWAYPWPQYPQYMVVKTLYPLETMHDSFLFHLYTTDHTQCGQRWRSEKVTQLFTCRNCPFKLNGYGMFLWNSPLAWNEAMQTISYIVSDFKTTHICLTGSIALQCGLSAGKHHWL